MFGYFLPVTCRNRKTSYHIPITGIVVEATWRATPMEKTRQEAIRPIRRPILSPKGEAQRAPKKVPADKIETINEV